MTTQTRHAPAGTPDGSVRTNGHWALLTNHGASLLYVARHPNATVRQVGDGVGVTERAAARILRDLREEGYLKTTRVGRRNSYEIDASLPMRHSATRHRQVADLLVGLLDGSDHLRPKDVRGT
jgi:hypothetical protein